MFNDDLGAGNRFYNRIRSRLLYKNKNWLCVVCGETGSGKSYSALSIAQGIGGAVHIVFNAREFLEIINSGRLKRGDTIIFDEAGVGMSSREWYSLQNRLLGSVLQTFRNLNCAVIFTCPNLSFIDIQARKLFHCYMETNYLDYETNEAFLKVFDIEVNSRYDKVYYKYPEMEINERVYTMDTLVVDKPDKKTSAAYEERKQAYTKDLNANALAELNGLGQPKQAPEKDINAIAKEVQQNTTPYLKEYKKRRFIDIDLLRTTHKLTISEAKLVKSKVESTLVPL